LVNYTIMKSVFQMLLLFLCVSQFTGVAQENSEIKQLKELAKTDLKRAEALLNGMLANKTLKLTPKDSVEVIFYKAYILVNLGYVDSALMQFNHCLIRAEKIHQNHLKVLCQCEIGNIYYNWGNYEKALQYFLKSQKESLIMNDAICQAEALNYIGKYHHSLGNFDKSLEYFNSAQLLAKRHQMIDLQATLNASIGKYYESLGNYDVALTWYLSALRLKDSLNNRMIMGTIYNHLGNLYQAIGNFEQSLAYQKLGLEERIQLGYVEGISKSFKNIGEVYLDLKLPDTAMIYFTKALQFANDYSRTRNYCFQALNLSSHMGYDKGFIQANYIIGQSFYYENQLEKAETFFIRSLQNALLNGMKEEICDNSFLLYQLNQQLGKTDKTLEYLKKYYETKMEIVNEQTTNHLAELEVGYEMEQKEKANELLRKQNEINTLTIARKNGFITLISIILGLTLIAISAFYLSFKSKQKANRQLALLNTEIISQNRKLTKLNEQLKRVNREKDNFFSIIAHEVRNPLWWFRNLAETLSENYDTMPKDKLGKAIQSLDESAKNSFHLMDNLLQWSKSQLNRMSFNPQELNLAELIDENIKLWKTAATYKSIQINIDTDPKLRLFADRDMINTLIRNLLSNAIKYTHVNGTIEIKANQLESSIQLTIKDSGIGISKANLKKLFDPNHQFSTLGIMQEKGSGIGLKLCKDFIELNRGTIEVESTENQGTLFRCVFPI